MNLFPQLVPFVSRYRTRIVIGVICALFGAAAAGMIPQLMRIAVDDVNTRGIVADNLIRLGGLLLLAALIDALHAQGFEIAVETNGTIAAPEGLDWICVSPKAGTHLVQTHGQELKLVYPQPGLMPDDLPWSTLQFENYLLQPMDGAAAVQNTAAAVAHCQAHPHWRLSVQTHKIVGIR